MRTRSLATYLGSVGALTVVLAAGCDRPNPLYHPRDGAATGQAGDLGGPGTAGTMGQAGDMGAAGDQGQAGQTGLAGTTGAAGSTDGGAAGTGAAGTGTADGGGDTAAPACKQAGDCLTARGAPPCGAWECKNNACAVVCALCTDADGDGFGVGPGCAGPDCDDANPNVGRAATRACYDGKGGTMGVGTCRAGAQVCADGVWSACNGQILPSGEACNGLDDDCNGKPDDGLGTIACGLGVCAKTALACSNGTLGVCQPAAAAAALDNDCDGKDSDCDGAIDEDCAGACVRVTPNGDDGSANGTTNRPFRSIQAAINFAAATPAAPKAVCIAGGMTCAEPGNFQAPDGASITMANGVSVYGNYELKNWTRCPVGAGGVPTLNVTLEPRSTKGVLFPATVTLPTVLDGVRILHFTGGNGGSGNVTSTAAVSVEGAKQAVISNVIIDDVPNVATTYGVLLTGGAEALITRSFIVGGAGSTESVGVRSVASKPTIRDNCNTVDAATGRCTSSCAPGLNIRGRVAQTSGARSVAVDLVDSPGAIVERSTICSSATNALGVRVSGAATGTVVRGNWIAVAGGTGESRGVSLEPCGDAAPWIVGNELIQADGAMRVAGVSAAGACHPVIDGNVKITGGGEGTPTVSVGVACGAAANVASRCTVIGNKLVQGSPSTHPAASVAVACDGGGCARITGNKIVGQGGGTVVGLSLSGTGALVDRNDITGGCGTKTTTGLLAEDAFARIENNLILGSSCGLNLLSPSVDGLHAHVAAGGNEIDVHSNTILAGGAGACQGAAAGIGLGAGVGPKTPRGIFRDNIMRAGLCTIARYDFWEDTAGTTPRVFQNNDLDPTGLPTALYLTGVGPGLSSAAMVNALPGAAGNISADPMFAGAVTGDLHLTAASACVNAGTPAGAPKADYDGKARDEKPDIGAYEK